MNKKFVIAIFAGVIFLSLVIAMASGPSGSTRVPKGETIGVIFVEGVITGARAEEALFGGTAGGASILEQLKEAREDDSIRAVLLRINSPGGSAAASQEIGIEIDKLRKEGKIVVTSMGDVAASGGYWIAAKSDRIVADPATMTGSIGVIMDLQNMQELFDKIGITPETIKSGPHKDMGSPTRPLTSVERDILQSMVDDIYDQFVDVVAKGRMMNRDKVLQLADGRIFTGRQAKDNGLVDELGNYYDAIAVTAKLAKIEGEPLIRELGPRTTLEKLFGRMNGMLNNYSGGLSPKEIQLFREIMKSWPVNNNFNGGPIR